MSTRGAATLTILCSLAPAQMEKRDDALYAREAFERSAPALGGASPELVLPDLEGRPWALSAVRGRIVVLIKGGYT